mmetsp:Transcript_38995/g.107363  ORF Transcript_38995/g.107363 Transcript_38995/m.107363 type:complete len:400 (+) Transcript_38995:84-1283(+)
MGNVIAEITQPCCSGSNDDGATETSVENGAPYGSFMVTLDRSGNQKLGLDVVRADGALIPIRNITGGLAEKWNQDHPTQQMKTGDAIGEVNGIKGDSSAMMQRCKVDKVLKLRIIPSNDAPAKQVPASTSNAAQSSRSNPIPDNDSEPGAEPAAKVAAKPKIKPSAKTSAKAKARAGRANSDEVDPAALAQFTDMGIPVEKAREALLMTGNDVQMAMGIVGVDQDAVDSLVAMGFSDSDSRAALARNGGDFEQALGALTGGATPGGGGGGDAAGHGGDDGDDDANRGGAAPALASQGAVDRDALASLIAMGFPEQQAHSALLACGNSLEQAIEICSGADASAGGGDGGAGGRGGGDGGGGGDPGVQQLVAMGFTEQQARDALDGASGNVELATAILLGS